MARGAGGELTVCWFGWRDLQGRPRVETRVAGDNWKGELSDVYATEHAGRGQHFLVESCQRWLDAMTHGLQALHKKRLALNLPEDWNDYTPDRGPQ